MDDIAKHYKVLKRPYVRSPKAAAIVASAKRLAHLVLQDHTLIAKHRIAILHLAQWFVSEADGKHKTRFRSKRVVDLATAEPTSTKKINHDHVFTRKEVTRLLLNDPSQADELLDTVLGCIVLKEEHDSLNGDGVGWERYRTAGIVVLDTSTDPPSIHDVV